MKPCLIIKAGEKIPSLAHTPGDDEDWIVAGMGLNAEETLIVAPYRGEALPEHHGICGVVVTGSCAMVTDGDEWIATTAEWLCAAVEHPIPILGICFGHQLLAQALGGTVDFNPAGVEVGTTEIALTPAAAQDPLLQTLPDAFLAHLSHCQSVLQLPPGARHLACSSMESNQAFAYGDRVWGLQFHPEFDETITGHFIEFYREQLQQEGRDADQLLEARQDTPHSHTLLSRFADLLNQPKRS